MIIMWSMQCLYYKRVDYEYNAYVVYASVIVG